MLINTDSYLKFETFQLDIQQFQKQMSSGKSWLPHEDQALLELCHDRKITSWSKISQILANQFKIFRRSPKKCRERYNNHLNPHIKREKWTIQEQQSLLALHDHYGNRWAEISKMLPGRTENNVKNKFYSKYRKSLKNIKSLIIHFSLQKRKQINISFVYRLMNILQNTSRKSGPYDQQIENLARIIKNEIITFQNIDFNNLGPKKQFQAKIELLMLKVHRISTEFKNRAYRTKNKLIKTKQQYSIKQQELMKQQEIIKHQDCILEPLQDLNQANMNEISKLDKIFIKINSQKIEYFPMVLQNILRQQEQNFWEPNKNQDYICIGFNDHDYYSYF